MTCFCFWGWRKKSINFKKKERKKKRSNKQPCQSCQPWYACGEDTQAINVSGVGEQLVVGSMIWLWVRGLPFVGLRTYYR